MISYATSANADPAVSAFVGGHDSAVEADSVLDTVARARGGVGPPPGFTAQSPPGAIASSVKPGVCPTPGRPRTSEARGWASPAIDCI